ncbi:Cyclic di-GMP phosphodiesterase [bioreactor metagenome]|uniref:Cyclic di-GMP phosphodiesterase n=1 Tax=bioreactor metagenome TaxID=1076179 RepID=A0A644V8L5_9ZZZZ
MAKVVSSKAPSRSSILLRLAIQRPTTILPVPSRCNQARAPAPLAEELCRARDLYFDACSYIKNLMQEKKVGAIEVAELRAFLNEIIQSLHRNFNALLLITTIKKTSDYTYRHSINVAIFSIAFAQFLGLDDDETFDTGMAGLFHDYGKAFVPQEILNAPRSLSLDETSVIRSHVKLGHDNLKDIPWVNSVILDGILHHHERHDGSGYPHQLSGEAISLHGSIISICDVYDALTSTRVYKNAIPPAQAVKKLFTMSGQAWAPGLVEHFIKLVGIFPVGTVVQLSNETTGIVCQQDHKSPLKPTVLVILKKDRPYAPYYLKLAQNDQVSINRVLVPSELASIKNSQFYRMFLDR